MHTGPENDQQSETWRWDRN